MGGAGEKAGGGTGDEEGIDIVGGLAGAGDEGTPGPAEGTVAGGGGTYPPVAPGIIGTPDPTGCGWGCGATPPQITPGAGWAELRPALAAGNRIPAAARPIMP